MRFDFPKYFNPNKLKCSGIYFLIRRNKVVYIGQSKNVLIRLFGKSHPIMNRFKFDSVRVIECKAAKLNYYESRWIMRFRPKYNTQHIFRWVGSFSGKRRKVPINLHMFPGSQERETYLKQKNRIILTP